MRAGLILLCLLAPVIGFAAPDYEREKRWDEEITPGIIVGEPVYLSQKNQHKFLAIYTEAANPKMGVVVVHGLGIHPDWDMIGRLRQRLPDFGYATLSVQMPILAVDAKPQAYIELFPEAVERLQLAVDYLKGKGLDRIAIVSHSMGSRMSHEYLSRKPSGVSAWAALGMPVDFTTGAAITYDGIKVPVLDLYGEDDFPQVLAGADKRKASLKSVKGSKQVKISGADHFYAGHEEEMIEVVKDFLDSVK
jgi:pimeloyl-ACP methyl ester carboxylesterase